MRDFPARPLCFLLAVLLLAFQIPRSNAQDPKALTDLKAQAQTALEKKTQAEQSLKALQKTQADLKTKLIQTKSAPAQAKRKQTAAEAELKKQQEELKKVQATRDAAAAAAKAAEEAFKKAEEALKKANEEKAKAAKMLADQQAAFQKVDVVVKANEKTIAEIKDIIAKAPEQAKAVETEIAAVGGKVTEAQNSLDAVTADWLAKQKAVESHLIAAGQMVSFSESMAPIFSRRCVACHNARTAKGRLNLETFAAMTKGGESGGILEAGDPDSSNLVFLIEDGSMPKDDDRFDQGGNRDHQKVGRHGGQFGRRQRCQTPP